MTGAEFEVFFDSDCPLCRREIEFVRHRDRAGRIVTTDIAAPNFRAPPSLTHGQLIARIHGRLPDGTVVEGVEVFRRMYAALGYTRLVALSRVPPLSWALDLAYGWFAKNRLRITGRCSRGTCRAGAA